MKATITPRPPQSSALQVYQRLAAGLIDDAAKELASSPSVRVDLTDRDARAPSPRPGARPGVRSFIDDLPAHDLDAEERVLGAIMIGPSGVVDELIELGMSVASFYSLNHRLIWASAIEVTLRDEKPDEILIIDQLRRNGLLEKVGGPSSVLSLAHTATTVTGVAAHARVLRDQEQRREARAIAIELGDVSGNGFKPERVGQLRERLDALAANPAGSNKLRLTPQSAAALMTLPEPPESDEILGRLVIRRQRLVIGAATGDGKTTMSAPRSSAAIALGPNVPRLAGCARGRLSGDRPSNKASARSTRRLREAGLDEVSSHVDILPLPPTASALDTGRPHTSPKSNASSPRGKLRRRARRPPL